MPLKQKRQFPYMRAIKETHCKSRIGNVEFHHKLSIARNKYFNHRQWNDRGGVNVLQYRYK